MFSSVHTLEDLFEAQLHDIYYAEQKLTKALPKMAEKATNAKLEAAFTKHLRETEDQIRKLEQVMKSLDITVKAEKCDAIEGIVKEAEHMMKEAKDPEVLDAALIAAAQKVEHYEIATYGTLCTFAKQLGYTAEGKILHSILEQEKATDEALSGLAETGGINRLAQAS